MSIYRKTYIPTHTINGMKDYIKITKKIDCNRRIRFDNTALSASGAECGDMVEILFKVVKKGVINSDHT